MKAYAFVASLIGLLPAVTAVNIQASWSVSNMPSSGLKDITFPLTIIVTAHTFGIYFAQQFGFVGSNDVRYTGLQPRPDSNGQSILHGVFSSFINGTTTTDPNCSNGADGGPGVSCSFEWNGVYGRMYNLQVQNGGGQLWVSTAIDTIMGEQIYIGSYTLPAGVEGIQSTQLGFVEYYLWDTSSPCDTIPYQETIFGIPSTTNLGSVGTQGLFYEYNTCAGEVAFSTQAVASGVEVISGF